jgi:Ca2+-binding EF-hand superfamily protein
MSLPALLVFLAAAQPAEPPPAHAHETIVVTAHGGIPFITPMGEPIRARTPNEDTLARWFYSVDLNRDGYLTPDELQAYAARYFAILDTNGDGQIDPDELVRYEWQVAPEIQVNSRFRHARAPGEPPPKVDASDDQQSEHRRGHSGGDGQGDSPGDRPRDGAPAGLQGAARYALLNIPEPVAAADADLDRAISLQEFKQAALERFNLLDTHHEGRISLQELETLRTTALAAKPRDRKHDDDAMDARVGVPLPPGN